jgi:hypothetical protein
LSTSTPLSASVDGKKKVIRLEGKKGEKYEMRSTKKDEKVRSYQIH